jgi:predicted component of type VI protein secretion system
MPPQLVAVTDGPNIPLDKPIVLIGRHQECDIQIPSRKISRRHCCVAQVYNYLVVRDLGSTNGVRINGARAVEGKLEPGDEVTIGNLTYRVQWDDHMIAAGPPRAVHRPALQSSDQPFALPDSPNDGPVPQAKPAHPLLREPQPPNSLLDRLDLRPFDHSA